MDKSRRKRASNNENGAALVEAAIIFAPLCLILFGIIEFGFIFKDSLTLSSAARAGARTASAEPREATFNDDALLATVRAASASTFKANEDQIWVYKAANNGEPIGGASAACGYNASTYFASGGSTCTVYTYVGGTGGVGGTGWQNLTGNTWAPSSQSACLGGTIDSVGIRIQLHHTSITGFFGFLMNGSEGAMVLKEKTVMRLEPLTQSCS